MMPFSRVLSVPLLLVTLAASAAPAMPALSGSSGLIRIPTAYTLDRGEFDLATDVHWFERDGAAPDVRFINTRLVAGVFEAEDHGAELGLHRVDIEGFPGSGTAITAKYRFEGILPLGAFAVGGRVSVNGPDQNVVYAVGSTNAARTFAVHYGVGVNVNEATGLFSPFGSKDSTLTSNTFFAMFGAEMDFGKFKLNADFNGDGVAYGVNYYALDSLVANLFILDEGNLERVLGGHYNVGFGVTLQF